MKKLFSPNKGVCVYVEFGKRAEKKHKNNRPKIPHNTKADCKGELPM